MPKVLIGSTFLKSLARAAAPASEVKHYDTRLTGFHVRHLPSGRASFAMTVARGKSVSLGAVSSWADADAARDHALALLQKFRQTGIVPTTARPDAVVDAGISVADAFGLRHNLPVRGTAVQPHADDVAGLYRATLDPQASNWFKVIGMLDMFVRFIGATTPLQAVTSDDVRGFLLDVSKRRTHSGAPVQADTVQRYLMDLRTAFRWAAADKHVAVDVCATVKLSSVLKGKRKDKVKLTRWLLPHEETAVRKVLAERNAAIAARPFRPKAGAVYARRRLDGCKFIDYVEPLILLALNTGGRRGGLFSLRWRHVLDVPYPCIVFEGRYQKAGQTYYVPLNREARTVLAQWRPADAKPNDLIFESPTGKRLGKIDAVWNTIRQAAGIPDVRFHDLRHTFASKLVQRGVSLFVVAKLMGHADQRMTARYAHLDPGHTRGPVELLLQPLPALDAPLVDDALPPAA